MLRSLYAGISGMKVNQTKLDVTGNNVANVGTTAYKGSRVLFQDTLGQTLSQSLAPGLNQGGQNGKSIGLGSEVATIGKLMTEGTPQPTQSNYDCAITGGEGYFIVASGTTSTAITTDDTTHAIATSDGAKKVKFTRDGSFTHDEEGNLLTANGDRVMGYLLTTDDSTYSITRDAGAVTGNFVDANSADLKAGDTPSLVPLAIPTSVKEGDSDTKIAVTSFSINSDGLITGVLADGRTTAIGQIGMASFQNPAALSEQGQNCFISSANSGEAIVRTAIGTEADKDNSKGYGSVRQYALEMSNVDLSQEFTDMIVASRAFQANGKTITNGDEILQDIINLKR